VANVSLEKVNKVYENGFHAVKDMSLEIADGEFMVLVGPSGCGKTTALRMVAGLEDITSGILRIGGKEANDETPKERDIAMVFQNYALYPHMTVAQNIGFALKLRKLPKAELDAKVKDAADILGLTDWLDRKPGQLSGGQRQRVAMGRAIVRQPSVFLMDEPLSNLDAKLRVQMRGELARLRDRLHTTTIYVTHDQIEAMTLGDRVAVMRDGVVQQLDTPNALYQRPANLFVGAFIGSPSMNLVEARVEGREVCFAEYRLPVADRHDLRAYNGRSVVLGMRPSDFEDATVWRDESRATMRVRVDLVEELGSQVNLLFTIAARSGAGDVIAEVVEDAGDSLPVPLVAAEGTSICTACVTAASPARAGGEAEVSVDPALFHYFDPDTGVAVGTATTAPATA
jgi:multiple sugar transport system ATP-binding protein